MRILRRHHRRLPYGLTTLETILSPNDRICERRIFSLSRLRRLNGSRPQEGFPAMRRGSCFPLWRVGSFGLLVVNSTQKGTKLIRRYDAELGDSFLNRK